ncbi:hypothetical protein EON63_21250 [archaeon]|nr:MAG: hypothetical protein EON63_21250 [archaeon]
MYVYIGVCMFSYASFFIRMLSLLPIDMMCILHILTQRCTCGAFFRINTRTWPYHTGYYLVIIILCTLLVNMPGVNILEALMAYLAFYITHTLLCIPTLHRHIHTHTQSHNTTLIDTIGQEGSPRIAVLREKDPQSHPQPSPLPHHCWMKW